MKLTELEALVNGMREELAARGQEDADVEFYISRNMARVFLDTSREFLDTTVRRDETPISAELNLHRIAYPGMTKDTPVRGWALPLDFLP